MTQIYCEIMENCEELAIKERIIDEMNYWGCKKHLRMSPVKIKHIWERDGTGKHPNQKTIEDYNGMEERLNNEQKFYTNFVCPDCNWVDEFYTEKDGMVGFEGELAKYDFFCGICNKYFKKEEVKDIRIESG